MSKRHWFFRAAFPGILILCGLAIGNSATAQTFDYWPYLLHPEALLDTLPYRMNYFSSWASNGGNSDCGFYHGMDQYGWKILCDTAGPGVMTLLRMARQPIDHTAHVRIYVDNTTTAVIDTCVQCLFGHVSPFVPPLADSSAGAFFSYLPIPFRTRLRVTYTGPCLYYGVSVMHPTISSDLESFTMPPSVSYLAHMDSLASRFNHRLDPAWPTRPYSTDIGHAVIAAGQTAELTHHDGSGGCRRYFLRIVNHTQAVLDDVWVKIYSDHNPFPDISGPLAQVFGGAEGWHPYLSCLNGITGDSLYLNLPMEFGTEFRVEVQNRIAASQTVDSYAEIVNLNPADMRPLKIAGIYNIQNPTHRWMLYPLVNTDGPGSLIGVMLDMQSTDSHIFEGDETMWLDHEVVPTWRGSGTEDYFNAGYYWGDSGGSRLAYHGAIYHYGATAAAYRWHLADPVPFRNVFQMTVEVGPWDNLTGYYRSMAFFTMTRHQWQIDDEDHNQQTLPGEQLRIVGLRLAPGSTLLSALLGDSAMQWIGGMTAVNNDSVLDVTLLAPNGLATGVYPVVMNLSAGSMIADSCWQHFGLPQLSFIDTRLDEDTLLFKGDTINVTLGGLAPGTTANLYSDNLCVAWVGVAPVANSVGYLTGRAIIPAGLSATDHELHAVVPGTPDVPCPQRLKIRSFIRFEVEELPTASQQAGRTFAGWVFDYMATGVIEPWGRNILWQVNGTGIGNYVQKTFVLPAAGTFQVNCFFGRTNIGSIIRTSVDDSIMIPSYDSYYGPIGWRWTRSDTIRGISKTLSAGQHTIRFDLIGRNSSATDWQMLLDQIVLKDVTPAALPVPDAVSDVVALFEDDGIRLCWSPVRQDVAGNSFNPSGYAVYRAAPSDSAFALLAQVSGTDTTFLDTQAASAYLSARYYVVAQSGQGSLSLPDPILKRASGVGARSRLKQ